MLSLAEVIEVIDADGPRCQECGQPADPESSGLDGMWCWGCYPVAGYTPEGTATEDVLVAAPNARNVTPR